MIRLGVVLGALLTAAPIFSQVSATGDDLIWMRFKLNETREQVKKVLGPPAVVSEVGDLEAWRYQIGVADHHDYSHELVFRISTGRLISVTRDYEPERMVDDLFPVAETTVQHYPDAKHSQYGARMRRLEGGRVLLAMGSASPGKPVGKLLLIGESEVPNFVEWVKLPK